MRKLILAPMALACLIGTAAAQQAPTMNVGNFPATQPVTQSGAWGFGLTGPIPAGSNIIGGVTQSGAWTVGLAAGSNAIGSVLADLRVAGAAVTPSNPVSVTVSNFPATQAVSQSGTWSFGLSGPIPAGTNVIGSVTQSAGPWSVSGTVAATQSGTWNVGLGAGSNNIGSIGNAFALDSTIQARLGTLGQKASVQSAPVVLATDQPALPLSSNAATAANQATEISALQSLVAGTKIAAAFPFTETTTPLAAGASWTGSAHNTGTINNTAIFAYVSATFFADQAGTAFLEQSLDASTWYPLNTTAGTPYTAGTAVAAGQSVTIKAPATMNIYRVRYTNNSTTAQTKFAVGSMFSAF